MACDALGWSVQRRRKAEVRSGTYMKPDGPPILRKTKETPGQRMVGVILNTKENGVCFLKLTGPDATVAAQLDAVRASFGGKHDDEKEYEF